MELKQKGQEAYIPVKQLMVTMKWSTAADFDLAAVYETKTGKEGLIYFGDLGDMNAFPYINLNKDEGVGDKAGDNEETMRITQLDDMKYIWILCWDYGMIQNGRTARFKDSDIKLTILDDTGKSVSAKLDSSELANICCIAMIDNSSPIGAKLINTSKTGTLKGLKTLGQILEILRT